MNFFTKLLERIEEADGMAQYIARVSVPELNPDAKNDDPTYIFNEILVDDIKAKSQKVAIDKAIDEGYAYMKYLWADPTLDVYKSLPKPKLIAISRVRQDGRLVCTDFDDDCDVIFSAGLEPVPHTPKQALLPAAVQKQLPSANQTSYWSSKSTALIDDPFIDDVINHVKEKVYAKR